MGSETIVLLSHREIEKMRRAGQLDPPAADDALARLRIVEHGVVLVDRVLRLEIIRVGGRPVTIQGRADRAVIHVPSPGHCLRVAG